MNTIQYNTGSAFFLPHGTRIYNRLMDWIKAEYWKRGYEEVITPNIFNVDLWRTSGHWQHYKDDMFSLKEGDAAPPAPAPAAAAPADGAAETSSADDANALACVESSHQAEIQYALKPMNCPGHCLLFAHAAKSYRELPMRIADFGVLHRNEVSGALSGLTRVRRFCQDDAHIFCRKDQIRDEVIGALNFMKDIYGTLGMTFKLERSTRPAKAIGVDTPEGVAMWDYAENELTAALDAFIGKGQWRDNPGDGAFYGPKIDIKVFDAMKRKHQCATVQLDFQLPSRFGLEYNNGEKGMERPVMIHRAMLGSLERFIGVLTEHFAGKWPFWLSPRQVMIVSVHQDW
jgi:threonyl-tRNA synthetase